MAPKRKATSKKIGTDGEDAVVRDFLPAFPKAFRVKRGDYGIKDIDVILDGDFMVEVKTGDGYISKAYDGHLDQAEGYFEVRPTQKYAIVWVQDTPGRGRRRNTHAVMRGQALIDLLTKFKEMRDENERLRNMVKQMGGADARVAAAAVAHDNGARKA